MIRVAVKDGSPGNNNMRFVFQDAYDETSCIASQRRTFEEAKAGSIKVLPPVASQGRLRVKLGRECVAAYETGFSAWRGSCFSGEGRNSWRDFTNDPWTKRETGDEEAMAFEDPSSADLKSLWNRTRPRR